MSDTEQPTDLTTHDNASPSSSLQPSALQSRLSALTELAAVLASTTVSLVSAYFVYSLMSQKALSAEWGVIALVAIAAPTGAVGKGLLDRIKSAGTALMKG